MAKRRGLWLMWCAALGVLYLFENNTITRILLVCSLALALLDVLCVLAAARRLRCLAAAPERARKGGELPLDIRVDCPVPTVQLHARVHSENRLTGECAQAGLRLRRTGLGCAVQRCLLRAAHCGTVSVQVQVDVCGLLGLYERRAVAEQRVNVWVPPSLQPMQVSLSEDGLAWEEGATDGCRLPGDAGDSFAIRAYVPGDAVRLIHWKLSEKLDDVMLRAPEAPLPERLLLVIDLSASPSAQQIDAMTERLFSLSRALLCAGVAHGILWHPAQAVQPELRRVETEADRAAFEAEYFSVMPHRSAPLAPNEAAAGYSHVAVIGEPSLARAFAALGGRRVTLMTDSRDSAEGCRAVPLTGDAADGLMTL